MSLSSSKAKIVGTNHVIYIILIHPPLNSQVSIGAVLAGDVQDILNFSSVHPNKLLIPPIWNDIYLKEDYDDKVKLWTMSKFELQKTMRF